MFNFRDSQEQELSLTFHQETTKTLLGRTRTKTLLTITINNLWAEFNTQDFHTTDLAAGEIIESTTSTNGPVFITNVDFAQEDSLFWEHTQDIPAHHWVICFANLDEHPVQALFTNERFTELLNMITTHPAK